MNQCTARKISDLESPQIEMIRAWLHRIGEPETDHTLVLNKCRNDPEALEYFLKHAHTKSSIHDSRYFQSILGWG